ncbi:MAG: PHP domain-containing protein [Pseudomonadota bacterium]
MIDLHTHTNLSDGTLSPLELLAHACEAGVTQLAITDHDNDEAFEQLSKPETEDKNAFGQAIKLIRGIEFSTRWEQMDVHIVGLNYAGESEPIKRLIGQQRVARADRNRQICEKLARVGVPIQYSDLARQAGQPGRVHIAGMIVAGGYAKNQQKAFKRFLGRTGKAYIKSNWTSVSTAIAAIKAGGGAAVLAHPLKYDISRKKMRTLIADFAAMGGDAIEVISGKQVSSETQMLAKLATEHHLQASLGSDFHALGRPWAALGGAGQLPKQCEPIWQNWR